MKNQFKTKKLRTPIEPHQAPPKSHVDNIFSDPSIIKNCAHFDFNVKNLDKNRFV